MSNRIMPVPVIASLSAALAAAVVLVSCALPFPIFSVPSTSTPNGSTVPDGLAPSTTIRAAFTGKHSDAGYDADANGLFEHLKLDVELDVEEADSFGFMPALLDAHGNLIALGDLYPGFDHQAPLLNAVLDEGVQTVSIYFNGHSLRSHGTDGPYSITLDLIDENGNSLAKTDFTTGVYNHLQFQGLLPEVQGVGDSGVDTDSVPGYNLLRATLQIDMQARGDVEVRGQLFAGDILLGDAEARVHLSTGPHTLDLDFPGAAIVAGGRDGPYKVYLTVGDGIYTDNPQHDTAAYAYTEFQLAMK